MAVDAPPAPERRAPVPPAPPAATPAAVAPTPVPVDAPPPSNGGTDRRSLIAVSLTMVGAAVMAGGVFNGTAPRIWAGLAGLLGVGVAVVASRVRSLIGQYILAVVGIFAVGVVIVLPVGSGQLGDLSSAISHTVQTGKLLRPPVDYAPGWAAVLGWVMGSVGFAAAWIAAVFRRPAMAAALPLPVAAVCAISVPHDAQVPSGIAVIVLFVAALGVLAGAQAAGSEGRVPVSYEIRRGLRSLPVLAAMTVGLYFLSQQSFLFPHPVVDPAEKPQKPKATPLSQVPDKVLFEVTSSVTGPWVLGHLDVYDGTAWLLPAFAENQLAPVPGDGIVDKSLRPGARADFVIRDLSGSVLPGLPDTYGINAQGTVLSYDARNGNIRQSEGQVGPGFSYEVVAAQQPNEADLKKLGATPPLPDDVKQFTQIPAPGPNVQSLLDRAPNTSAWEKYNYLRNWVLDNVVAVGAGSPVDITPTRAEEIIQNKKASPYEMVALQAMLGRWAGLPTRIGFGFDGGQKVNGHLEVHPANGASFPEVYFPGFKWVPVIGTPKHAQAAQDNNVQQQNPNVAPSEDVAVPIFVPYIVPAEVPLYARLQTILAIVVPILLVLFLVYLLIPVYRKNRRRVRRRRLAAQAGPRAQIALAYAEWRDLTRDYGYDYTTDTPLGFADRFSPDEEHRQLAWLVTRALWGDLQESLTSDMAADARALSRSLCGRLADTKTLSVRVVSALSRASLKHPYEVDATFRRATPATKEVA